MANFGVDFNIIINGVGFFVKDETWDRQKKRLYRARVSKSGVNHYIDKGPLKNEFKFTLLCYSNLANFDGSTNTSSGFTYRNNIWTWYNTPNSPITIVTPTYETFTCLFLDLKERIITTTPLNSQMEFELDCDFLQT